MCSHEARCCQRIVRGSRWGTACHSVAGNRGAAERLRGCEHRLSSQAVWVQIPCDASFSSANKRESSTRKYLIGW